MLRVEDPRFLRGEARYVDHLALPNIVHAAFARSAHAAARIVSIDASAARSTPSVVGVFTGADLAAVCQPWTMRPRRPEVAATQLEVLTTKRARHVAQTVAVVATTPTSPRTHAKGILVDHEPLPTVVDPGAALELSAPLVDPSLATNDVGTVAGEGEMSKESRAAGVVQALRHAAPLEHAA